MLEFEWDKNKAETNLSKHGIAFQHAVKAFSDHFAIELIDDREDYGEERINLIGMCDGVILYVSTRNAANAFESFQQDERRNMSKNTIITKIRSDGTIVEVLENGSERPFPDTPMRPMTEEDIKTVALADPDARPMTAAGLRRARRVSPAKSLRWSLNLTQQEFSNRYQIPIGTLRDWEQGRTEPDQPAKAYLKVIAHDPEGVLRALQKTEKRVL